MNRIGSALVFLPLCLAVACGGDASVESAESEHTSGGGESMAQYEGPVTGNAEAGATVFADNGCNGCHPGVGPDLQGHGSSPAATRHIIREGEDRMPSFGSDKISDAQLEDLLAYLQSEYQMYQ